MGKLFHAEGETNREYQGKTARGCGFPKRMVCEMNDKKCCDHIKGVVCDVKNCAYHDGETRCTAGEITVGPTYASTSHDTACATFKPNQDMKG